MRSWPASVGDAVALYAAPIEGGEVIAQAALGSGSVTADAIGKRGHLVDADALAAAVDALPAGEYDVTVRLHTAPGASPGARGAYRTEVITLNLRDADEPGERATVIARAMQDVARNVVKEDSSQQVRLVGAVLAPPGKLGEAPRVDEAPPVEPPRRRRRRGGMLEPGERDRDAARAARARSKAARKGWETRRANAEHAKRSAAARKGWETRRRKARAAKRRRK